MLGHAHGSHALSYSSTTTRRIKQQKLKRPVLSKLASILLRKATQCKEAKLCGNGSHSLLGFRVKQGLARGEFPSPVCDN
jgi:hypothetical protein